MKHSLIPKGRREARCLCGDWICVGPQSVIRSEFAQHKSGNVSVKAPKEEALGGTSA